MTATTPKTEPQTVTRIRKLVTGGARVLIFAITMQLFSAFNAADADIINFDNLQPFLNGVQVPDGYGSTPAVTISYSTLYLGIDAVWHPFLPFVSVWNSGAADLTTAAFPGGTSSGLPDLLLEITLTANDPLQKVLLNSFQVGAYPGPGSLDAALLEVVRGSVPDGWNGIDGSSGVTVLGTSYNGATISGVTAPTLSPGPGAEANSLSVIVVTFTNNIGINHIDFDITPVPEPATIFLGGLGLIAFGYAARRRLFGRQH